MRTALIGSLIIAYTIILSGSSTPSATSLAAYFCFLTSAIFLGLYLKVSHRSDSTIIFFVFFSMFISIGAFMFSIYPYLLLHQISSGEQLHRELDWYALCMALAILTLISAALILKLGPRKVRNVSTPTSPNYSFMAWSAFTLIYLICLIGILAEPDYLSNLPKLFLGELTGGGFRKMITLKDSATSYPGKGLVLILKYQILPIIALIMISLNQGNKRLSWVILILTILMLFSEFRRGPVLQFAFSVIFLSMLCPRKIRTYRVLLVGGLVLLVYLGLTIVLGRAQGLQIGEFVFELLWRVAFSQTQTGTYVFQLFPNMLPFSQGLGYLNALPTILTGLDNRPLSVEVFYLIHGRQGGASFTSFAEAYANFSLAGVLFLAILLPVFFASQENRYLRNRDNPLEIAYYAFFVSFIVIGFALGSLIGPLINMLLARLLIIMIETFTGIFATKTGRVPSQFSRRST